MLFKIAKACFDLVYPLRCASCRRKIAPDTDIPLCRSCLPSMRKNRPPFCRRCGRTLGRDSLDRGVCRSCQRGNLCFDRAYAVFRYEGAVKALVHELKYRGKEHLGPALGRLMAGFITEFSLTLDFIDCIVPVPLHPARLREREFNQSLLLSREIAAALGKPVTESALSRTRNTRTQTELERNARQVNVEGSFAAGDYVAGKNILLVDDVMTTGATASEAARTLKQAGAGVVFVLTLAN